MTDHALTIGATGTTLAGIHADAQRQLAAYLQPMTHAEQIATVLIGEADIETEVATRSLDGSRQTFVAVIRIHFTTNRIAHLAQQCSQTS